MNTISQNIRLKISGLKKASVVLLFIFIIGASFSYAQQPSKEYQVKAVFLFNFSQFTDWPQTAFAANDAPFVIGVLGSDPFGNYLNETVAGEKKSGHGIVIRRFRDVKEVTDCDILFISNSEKTKDVTVALGTRSILTVGDAPDFATSGGMIQFFTENNKIRFKVNLSNAKNAGLSISSKLLRLAEIVQ